MYPLTPSDLASIWQARLQLRNIEEALPKVLALLQQANYRHRVSFLTVPLIFKRMQVILAMPRNDLQAQVRRQHVARLCGG